jgi:cobalt/nickel transport system permease protein
MHIPDGFLSTPVWATLDGVAIPAIALLGRRARAEFDESRIPLLGVMGAFVFAAQMINFPVGLGTSGHLVGGALLACALGPGPAALVMTAILAIQALVFQDGGIVVLGANVFNMAIAGVLAGYLPYRLLSRTRFRRSGVFLAGFLSVLVSAALALSELLFSGVRMPGSILAVSCGLFVISALLEGLITMTAVQAIERLHPAWVRESMPSRGPVLVLLGTAAVLLAGVGILIASQHPDGIQNLANQTGIATQAKALITAPLADYQLRGIDSPWMRRAGAGLAGVGTIYLICLGLGRFISRRRASVSAAAGGA